jgi:peptide/nickel transport system substrate-binding protein
MLAAAGPAGAETVIRMASDGDLKILDPIWTTQFITIGHGYMIYDVPYALDADGRPQPQMIGEDKVEADARSWTFRLRPGLVFQDGTPVSARDLVASIKRWGGRATAGRLMLSLASAVETVDDRTFAIRFREPFGPVRELMANPINPLFIMREAEASTDPNTQVTSTIGSGPFRFVREEWAQGSKVVYAKNQAYVPRPEPASGMAGGKRVLVDRVEWVYLPEPATAVDALIRGEIDILENPSSDLVQLMRKGGNIDIRVLNRLGNQLLLRPNHTIAPFDNPKARRALLYAVDQKAYLSTAIGDPQFATSCWAVFMCGTPLASDAGVGDWADDKIDRKAKARALLGEAGYKGEPIVVLRVTDEPILSALGTVSGQLLAEAGFNVDLQNVDLGTFGQRRTVREAPAQNRAGWHIAHSWASGPVAANPLTNNLAPTPCQGPGFFGWPCDAALEEIRLKFIKAGSAAERKAIADEFQAGFYETVPYIPLGQFRTPSAFRSNIHGMQPAARLVMWNISKD